MTDAMTLDLIDQMKAKIKNHIAPTTIDVGGRRFYMVVMSPAQAHDMAVMRARADWRDYYRSVRIQRRLCEQNYERYMEFNRAWCAHTYQQPTKDRIKAARAFSDRIMARNRTTPMGYKLRAGTETTSRADASLYATREEAAEASERFHSHWLDDEGTP